MIKNISQLLLVLSLFFVAQHAIADEVSGVVRWSNNEVAVGVTISVRGYSVITDSKGRYIIPNLSSGTHVLTISPPGKITVPVTIDVSGKLSRNLVVDW